MILKQTSNYNLEKVKMRTKNRKKVVVEKINLCFKKITEFISN
jgi:hypothetical protein